MVDISSAMVGRRRVADGRSVVAWIGPLVGVILIFTVLNPQYRWFTTDREFEISPGRVLDIVTLVLIVLVLHVLRSLHRIQAEAKLVTAAALILVSGVVTAISMASVALDTEMLHRANVGAGMTITALTIVLSLDLRSPRRFASFCLLAAGGLACSAVVVFAGVALVDPNPWASYTVTASLAVVAGVALTVIGLRRDDVTRQILGLVVLSAATLGTHFSGSNTGEMAVLLHQLTFIGLLSTLAIQTVVELRNLSVTARSAVDRATAELDFSQELLRAQREERARLVHDSRNALLVIQAGLQAVAHDDSETLIASLHSELNRIQAMIERNHTPIESIDVAETLGPMFQCYESGGVALSLSIAVPRGGQVPYAMASRTQLVEVMQNLVENAIRHSGSELPIEISIAPVGAMVEIQVRDHGSGIDLRDRLRASERISSKSGIAAGRGLSICQRLMEEMNGELDFFTPANGVGSVFRVRLPAMEAVVNEAVA